LLPW